MIIRNYAGQSMVELLVILFSMLILILGTIQFALIYQAKITLNYATYEAVRAGTLNNATFNSVKEGFARGLAPLYSYSKGDKDQVGAFQDARKKVLDEFNLPEKLIRIRRLSPTPQAFSDFSNEKNGIIPNDNLRFRTSTVKQKSGMSIQDANLLHLKITYWYPLYVPFVNKMIFKVFCPSSGDKVCSKATPRIPITSVSVMRMQTPAHSDTNFYTE